MATNIEIHCVGRKCGQQNNKNPIQVINMNNENNENSKKVREIIVNGQPKETSEKELTFAQIVALAFNPVPTGPYTSFTVTYRRGHGNKPEGTLVAGESVMIKDGMIFNVTATDKS